MTENRKKKRERAIKFPNSPENRENPCEDGTDRPAAYYYDDAHGYAAYSEADDDEDDEDDEDDRFSSNTNRYALPVEVRKPTGSDLTGPDYY